MNRIKEKIKQLEKELKPYKMKTFKELEQQGLYKVIEKQKELWYLAYLQRKQYKF